MGYTRDYLWFTIFEMAAEWRKLLVLQQFVADTNSQLGCAGYPLVLESP